MPPGAKRLSAASKPMRVQNCRIPFSRVVAFRRETG
jgi:hypothetical protein